MSIKSPAMKYRWFEKIEYSTKKPIEMRGIDPGLGDGAFRTVRTDPPLTQEELKALIEEAKALINKSPYKYLTLPDTPDAADSNEVIEDKRLG